jgi:hypothetical protein
MQAIRTNRYFARRHGQEAVLEAGDQPAVQLALERRRLLLGVHAESRGVIKDETLLALLENGALVPDSHLVSLLGENLHRPTNYTAPHVVR